MTPLTDTEINERLAKGMGWKTEETIHGVVWWVDAMGAGQYLDIAGYNTDDEIWNPVESLDQMHLVETRIIELGLRKRYIHWIAEDMFSWSHYWSFDMLHLTSRQKALAAVKTFGEVEK